MLIEFVLLVASAGIATRDGRQDCSDEPPPSPPIGTVIRVPAVKRATSAAMEARRVLLVDGVEVQDELFAVKGRKVRIERVVTWAADSCLARVDVYLLRRYSHQGRAFAYLVWAVPHVGKGVVGGVMVFCLVDRDGDGGMDDIFTPRDAPWGSGEWLPPLPPWLAGRK